MGWYLLGRGISFEGHPAHTPNPDSSAITPNAPSFFKCLRPLSFAHTVSETTIHGDQTRWEENSYRGTANADARSVFGS